MIPVKRKDGTSAFIDYEAILFWKTEGYEIVCVTENEEFYWLKDLEDFEILQSVARSDRSYVARFNKIKRYNRKWKTLHFHESKRTPYVTVSRYKKKLIEKLVEIFKIPTEEE